MPPRKKVKVKTSSKAVSSKSKISCVQKVTDNGSSSSSTPNQSTVVARRDRQLRGRRGGLEGMPNLPVDLLLDIFGFLHPQDLLSLARTTRAFRKFLRDRKSATFWKASRKQVEGLPDPPPHLSEPAYANLLFSNHCHNCLKVAHVTPYWPLFVRYCSACRKECLHHVYCSYEYPGDNIVQWYNERHTDKLHREALMILIQNDSRARYDRYAHEHDLDKLTEDWKALEKADDAAKEKFVEDRAAFIAQCRKASTAIEVWAANIKKNELAEKETVREERFEAVLDKLRKEGWGDELDKMSEGDYDRLSDLPSVRRTTKLTDKAWTSMRDGVVKFMEAVQSKREAAEFKKMIHARVDFLREAVYNYLHAEWLQTKERVTYASAFDFALMREVRDILEDTSDGITKESIMAEISDILPTLSAKWMDKCRTRYEKMARKAFEGSEVANSPDILNLAIVSFHCNTSRCIQSRFAFPEILEHVCLKIESPAAMSQVDSHMDGYTAAVLSAHIGSSADKLHRPVERSGIQVAWQQKLTREVITACGQDPDTVTYAEMDACEARLRCRICATLAAQDLFTWRAAILHGTDKHSPNWLPVDQRLSGYWDRVPEDLAAKARALEKGIGDNLVHSDNGNGRLFCKTACMRCGSSHGYMVHVKDHIKTVHHKQKPELGHDFCLVRDDSTEKIPMYAEFYANDTTKKKEVDTKRAFFASF